MAEIEEDHYLMLGLPSGTAGAKLSEAEIRKAYRAKALTSHPDKRPNDPLAASNFLKIQSAYEILLDPIARKAFDDLLSLKQQRVERETLTSAKRRKMMGDLAQREKAFASEMEGQREREEEDRAKKRLQEEISRIRATRATKNAANFGGAANSSTPDNSESKSSAKFGDGGGVDNTKILKVSWNDLGEGYTVTRLREVFESFGKVEDVLIRRPGSKKKRSALVVMGSRDEVIAATRSACGDLSNPLLVLPLCPTATSSSDTFQSKQVAPDNHQELHNIVGAGYHAYEDSILQKLQKQRMKTLGPKNSYGYWQIES
ncbi:hypothetical protein AMTRI_Chr09g14960 [Amborella trichopoda]